MNPQRFSQPQKDNKLDLVYKGGFHPACGSHITLSNGLKTVTCTKSDDYRQRFVLSAKPIRPNEKIHLTLGPYPEETFIFGFTTVDPVLIRSPYEFQELRECSVTSTHNVCNITKDLVHLSFCYNEDGNISYTLDGKESTVYSMRKFSGLAELWALIYLRGQGATVTVVTAPEEAQIDAQPCSPMKLHIFRCYLKDIPRQLWMLGEEPLVFNKRIVTILRRTPKNEEPCSIMFGVTCCNPRKVHPNNVPPDIDLWLNNASNWFMFAIVEITSRNCGDELSFCITKENSVVFQKNQDQPEIVELPQMDGNRWPFVRITGEQSVYIEMFSGQPSGVVPKDTGPKEIRRRKVRNRSKQRTFTSSTSKADASEDTSKWQSSGAVPKRRDVRNPKTVHPSASLVPERSHLTSFEVMRSDKLETHPLARNKNNRESSINLTTTVGKQFYANDIEKLYSASGTVPRKRAVEVNVNKSNTWDHSKGSTVTTVGHFGKSNVSQASASLVPAAERSRLRSFEVKRFDKEIPSVALSEKKPGSSISSTTTVRKQYANVKAETKQSVITKPDIENRSECKTSSSGAIPRKRDLEVDVKKSNTSVYSKSTVGYFGKSNVSQDSASLVPGAESRHGNSVEVKKSDTEIPSLLSLNCYLPDLLPAPLPRHTNICVPSTSSTHSNLVGNREYRPKNDLEGIPKNCTSTTSTTLSFGRVMGGLHGMQDDFPWIPSDSRSRLSTAGTLFQVERKLNVQPNVGVQISRPSSSLSLSTGDNRSTRAAVKQNVTNLNTIQPLISPSTRFPTGTRNTLNISFPTSNKLRANTTQKQPQTSSTVTDEDFAECSLCYFTALDGKPGDTCDFCKPNAPEKVIVTEVDNKVQKIDECIICCESKVDAVLYKCGHNCMCMPCAQKQWKGKRSSGLCPICREPILDVIKLFN